MSVIDAAIILPKTAFLTAWQWQADALGEPHSVFGTNLSSYTTEEARRAVEAGTWELLAHHGLARRERLHPIFLGTLRAIAQADTEFFGWTAAADDPDGGGGFLVAARGEDAVRVAVDDEKILLQPIRARWLADQFVEVLPAADGAAVRSLSVTRKLYENPNARPANPLAPPVDTRDVDYVRDLLHAPRDAAHQLYTATRDSSGRRQSSPISAFDVTGRGRALTYLSDDEDGRECINLASGSAPRLRRLLEVTNESI